MDLSVESVLAHLECPVCILPPRASPVYQCPTGHIVCSDCQPSLSRCPICNVRFRKILTRDFFAEKLLELLERKCRFEVFGCEFACKVSSDLVEHERTCSSKPPQPVKRKKRKDSSHVEGEDNEVGENVEDPDNEEEILDEELLEDEEEGEEEEDVIEVEDVFVSNFAFIVVLLRAYMLEFAKYDPSDSDNFFFEYFLLFLLCVWLYHVWQENGFHIMLDETSPYIAGWFAATVVGLMVLKHTYLGQQPTDAEEGVSLEDAEVVYQGVMGLVKPCITLATGIFCCAIHAYVYDLREESWFVLGCVMAISVLLAGLELVWSLQAQMDLFYYIIFWLQSFFIVLPFGMIGRHFLEF